MRTYVVVEYYGATNHDVPCRHTHATLEDAALCYREHRYAWSGVVAVTGTEVGGTDVAGDGVDTPVVAADARVVTGARAGGRVIGGTVIETAGATVCAPAGLAALSAHHAHKRSTNSPAASTKKRRANQRSDAFSSCTSIRPNVLVISP